MLSFNKSIYKSFIAYFFILAILVLSGCDSSSKSKASSSTGATSSKISPTSYNAKGVVQKGPFLSGSKVVITELNGDLTKTSISPVITTTDSKGEFDIGSTFSHKYLLLEVSGKYFDEVSNKETTQDLTLTSIIDLTKDKTFNANVLTDIQTKRVRELIKSTNDYTKAKTQSKGEILSIFNIDANSITKPLHELDITIDTQLLRVSSILQGKDKSVDDVKDLINTITEDFSKDGKVKSITKTVLAQNEQIVKLQIGFDKIKQNLQSKGFTIGFTDQDLQAMIDSIGGSSSGGSSSNGGSTGSGSSGGSTGGGSTGGNTGSGGSSGSGGDGDGDGGPAPLKGVLSIDAGDYHTTVIDASGTLWTWGLNNSGQLGVGANHPWEQGYNSFNYINIPLKVKEEATFKSFVSGGEHSLAIDENGTLWAWGNNFYGQLGDGTKTDKNTPVKIKEGTTFISIDARFRSSSAIDENGNLWTWGYNRYGQLGDNTDINRTVPVGIKQGWH